MRSVSLILRRLISWDYCPILVLISISFAIGLLIVPDFGASWDEGFRYDFAAEALAAYSGDLSGVAGRSGPFYLMFAYLGADVLETIFPSWDTITAWHMMHFLTFLLGVFFFYLLCLQLVGKWAAAAGTLLFLTQPLLWGHAFINPKDIPFMTFFLGSVALGVKMAGAFERTRLPWPRLTKAERTTNTLDLTGEWRAAASIKKLVIGLLGAMICLIGTLLFAAGPQVKDWLHVVVTNAYNAPPNSALGSLFTRLASNSVDIPLAAYIAKVDLLYPRTLGVYFLFALLACTLLLIYLFPKAARQLLEGQVRPFLVSSFTSLRSGRLLLAGITLGMTVSIRVLGPVAGLLVGLYFVLQRRLNSIPPLLAYVSVAALTTYLTWPGLWGAPLANLIASLTDASDFPWGGKVMFAGIDYPADQLPRGYLPVLLSLQFSEPVLILLIIGMVFSIIWFFERKLDRNLLLVIILWFLVPFILFVVSQPTAYDNFRHLLFIIPPLFMIAAVGFKSIFTWVKKPIFRFVLIALLVMPGMFKLVALHPYQYVYYNRLAGGLEGVFRSYEMDYWATSYREAAEYVNRVAPADASVMVWGADHLVSRYVRPDLEVFEYRPKYRDEAHPADYVILSSRHNKDLSLYPGAVDVFSISRQGALFAVVKQFNAPDSADP